jgi:hypothetical protein
MIAGFTGNMFVMNARRSENSASITRKRFAHCGRSGAYREHGPEIQSRLRQADHRVREESLGIHRPAA